MSEITYWKPEPRRHSVAWWALLLPAIVYGAGVIVYAHNAFVPGLTHQNGHAIGSTLMVFGGESGTLAAAAEVFRKQAAKETNWMDWGGLAVSLVATLGNLFVVYVSLTELPVAWVGFVRLYGPLVLLICSGVDFYAGLMEFGFYNASFDARWTKWNDDQHTYLRGEETRQRKEEQPKTTTRKQLSDTELVSAFADLFDEVEPETPEEIDDALRDEGYDPDEVGARMAEFAERELAKVAERETPPDVKPEVTPLDGLAMQVYTLYTANPGITKTKLAELAGVSRPTLNKRLKLLVKAGKLPSI